MVGLAMVPEDAPRHWLFNMPMSPDDKKPLIVGCVVGGITGSILGSSIGVYLAGYADDEKCPVVKYELKK
ncbi:hypothetical protein IH992_07140 [Candidatus Poribacteria bacterium]|nr:hypothetical protein [Candidatus Poribacteria bacterium]